MRGETQPLINLTGSEQEAQVKKPSLHKGWFFVIGLVTTIFIVAAVFHKQLGNIFDIKNSNTEAQWVQIEDIDLKYVPTKWSYTDDCDDDEEITLTFAVKQQNLDNLYGEIMRVSDPKSEHYGEHWNFDQVHEFLAPEKGSLEAVYSWLNENGIEEGNVEQLTPNGDFIRVTTDIATANSMLNTQYGKWKTEESDKTHVRVKEDYYVPSSVSKHLDFISPTLRFPVESHSRKVEMIGGDIKQELESETTSYVTPSVLKELYGLESVKGGLSDENIQVVGSFLEEWFNYDDLNQFWEYFGIDKTTVTKVPEFQPSGYGAEAELDVQYITSTGEGVNTIVWDIEDDMYFITLLRQIYSSGTVPSVVSMSYGGDEQTNGYSYTSRANTEFAKVALLGITFFASSGDSGAISSSDICGAYGEYTPSFPATSQYVTAVGGVYGGSSSNLEADGSGSTNEIAWYYSGGGFSTFFDALDFQKDAVDGYFDSDITFPDSARYERTGRAYPDLAAQSEDYVICYEGGYYAVSGTSCSCPSVAGMFALINDMRLAAGKSRLGWINPALYSLYSDHTTYFNDVTEGYNMGCDDDGIAFYSNSGWDPITGLGTPKFANLLDAFFKLGSSSNDDKKSIFKYRV